MIPAHNTHRLLALLATLLLAAGRVQPALAQGTESVTEKGFTDARQLYDDGKMTEALVAFQKFESQNKLSTTVPQAIYFQGWCWIGLHRYQEAIDTFSRLIKAYPTASIVPEAILKQAECYRELKNYAKAVDLYRQFETQYPKHAMLPQAMLGEAWTLFKQNDLKGAKNVVQNARSQFSSDPVASLDSLFLLGQILTAEKNYDDARQIYKQIAAQRGNPRATEGLFLAGEAMFDAKRYADAITYYKRVQSRSALLNRIQEEMNALQSQRAAYLQRGAVGEYGGRLGELQQLQAKFKSGPDLRASALFRMANCYQLLGRPEESSVVYREFLTVYPDDKLAEQAQFALIQVLTERREFAEADAESKVFQKKYPNSTFSTDALFLQAETLFGSGQFQEALDRFQKFAATNKDPQLLETADFRIAACYYGLHDFAQARDNFMAFLQRHPTGKLVPDALFRLGRSYFEISQKATDPKVIQANLANAAKNYELIRTKFPNSELLPEVTFQLGYLYAYLGAQDVDATGKLTTTANFEKAIASFQEFTTKWPDNRLVPEALYQIARNQFAQSKFDAAIAAYQQLVEKFPEAELAPFAAYEIADCYAGEKKPTERIAALRDFVKRYPNHVRANDALFAIASQFETDKKPDEAITEYRNLINRTVSSTSITDNPHSAAIASELRIASILEARGAVADAVADCEGFLSKFKDFNAVRAMVTEIVTLYRRAKKPADAYAALDQLSSQYQQNATIRFAAATSTIDLALSENDTERAYAAALKLLSDPEKDHLLSSNYLSVGNALLHHQEFGPALNAYQKALALYSDDSRTEPLALVGIGEASLGLNQFAEAEKAFNQVATADPQGPAHIDAGLGLAKVYLARGKDTGPKDPANIKAVDLLNQVMASAKGENAGEAAFLLGNYFFNLHDNEKENKKAALAYYLRVALLTSGPRGEEAAFRSGQCHKVLGNTEAARSAFQSYLRRFPTGKFIADAKQELVSLPAPPQQP